MADKQTFEGRVANTNDGGFKLEGGEAWINFSKPEYGYVGPPSVEVGQVVRVTASPGKTGGWFASMVTVMAGGAAPPASATAPQPVPTASAPAAPPAPVTHAATAPAPAPSPSYQQYREDAAAPQETPQAEKAAPGSFAYKDSVAIPKAVALARAVESMAYMAAFDDLAKLRDAVLWVAQCFYDDFLAVGAEAMDAAQAEPMQSPPQDGDPGPGGP